MYSGDDSTRRLSVDFCHELGRIMDVINHKLSVNVVNIANSSLFLIGRVSSRVSLSKYEARLYLSAPVLWGTEKFSTDLTSKGRRADEPN